MRALTICQPYAHLIAIGEKRVENRRWRTSYRGPLVIHAGKSHSWLSGGDSERYPDMVFGGIIAIADLAACWHIEDICDRQPPPPFAWVAHHAHTEGPWCWVLPTAEWLDVPLMCSGARGLWIPTPEQVEMLQSQLRAKR